MKQSILFALLFTTTYCFAGKTDSVFHRHQVSFSMTNAMTHEFLSSQHGPTINQTANYWGFTGKYLPFYGAHFQIAYSLGLSQNIRLETGIGYLLQGIFLKGEYDFEEIGIKYSNPVYNGGVTLPIHVKIIKPMGKGAFTCTLGPSFTIPVNTISTQKYQEFIPIPSSYRDAGLGFDLKMGYEKKLTERSRINFGPVVNFSDLAFFDKDINQQYKNGKYRPYQYYIGFDVAFIFDAKKKK